MPQHLKHSEDTGHGPEGIALFCVIHYTNESFYRQWALSTYNLANESWITYEAVQDISTGMYGLQYHYRDPRAMASFKMLIPLGTLCGKAEVEELVADTCMRTHVPVFDYFGNRDSQDYVIGAWRNLRREGAFGHEAWKVGNQHMAHYYKRFDPIC